jgi:hypothetical protein
MTGRDDRPQWPTDKLNALRYGRRLVTEIVTASPGRRSFVEIRPLATAVDSDARQQGWTRSDGGRTFKLEHWDYAEDQIAGFDHDIGAILVRATTVEGEVQLIEALQAWNLQPDRFLYPWQTDDPK